MSTGTHGHSTTLTGSDSGVIGNVTKLDWSGQKHDSIDTSSCATVNKGRTFIAGMVDEGELNVDVVYDGSNSGVAQALDAAHISGAIETWTVAYPDGSWRSCAGFITNLGTAMSYDKEITQSITIKLTGIATFTPAVA